MIEIIEGKGVGAGKSYFVIERLMQHWANGGTAYVSESFCVVWEECKAYALKRWGLHLEHDQFHEVSSSAIARLHESTPAGSEDCPLLIVVDEAQDQLDVRDHANKEKKDVFSWCCQSRHDDNDLVFVSQSAKNLDARIRRLATFTWSVRNANNFTIQGLGNLAANIRFFTLGLNDGFYFIRTQLDYDGSTVLDAKWVKAQKGLFRCYKSKSMRNARKRLGAPVARKQLARAKGRHPMYKWVILGSLIVAGISAKQLFTGGLFSSGKPSAPVTHISEAQKGTMAKEQAQAKKYENRHEKWYAVVPNALKLESGWYRKGQLSAEGMVEAIQEHNVRVRKPDGGLLYIIGDDFSVPVGPPLPTPPPDRRDLVGVGEQKPTTSVMSTSQTPAPSPVPTISEASRDAGLSKTARNGFPPMTPPPKTESK